jgi:Reverse transcriptase (RNA-dependent DNA polymerase)
MFFSS